jgi:hypothetical protein
MNNNNINKKYIVFIEKNNKEHNMTVHYLQTTYNLDMLEKLYHLVKYANYNNMESSFDIDIMNTLSRKTVEEIVQVNIGDGDDKKLFNVSNGVFKLPFTIESVSNYDSRMMGVILNQYFSHGRIDNYFYSLDK